MWPPRIVRFVGAGQAISAWLAQALISWSRLCFPQVRLRSMQMLVAGTKPAVSVQRTPLSERLRLRCDMLHCTRKPKARAVVA